MSKMNMQSIERSEDHLNNKNKILTDQIANLTDDNSKLTVLLELYNQVLTQYQIKYGNELFEEVQNKYKGSNIDKYHLLNNFSILNEYEVDILKKDKIIDQLNNELINQNKELQDMIQENNNMNEELLKIQEERNNNYKDLLNPKNNEKSTQEFYSKSAVSFPKGSNNNLNNDYANYSNLFERQREELLSAIEKYKSEVEQLKLITSSLNERNIELQNENDRISKEYVFYKSENEDFKAMRSSMSQKYRDYNDQIIKLESELENNKNLIQKYNSEESLLKKEILFYKENYEDLENRKNLEIENLVRELSTLRTSLSDQKMKINMYEEDNSSMKFDLSKLRQELNLAKEDCIQLNKMLESANTVVASVQEKEKNLDITIKAYKTKLDNSSIEKEKAQLKSKLLEQQIIKLSSDYSRNSSERQEKYESFLETIQSKHYLIVSKKDEDITSIKNELVSIKIEKDRLYNDYNIVKKEYDRLNLCFKEEIDKCLKKFEEAEKNSLRLQENLIEKNYDLQKKYEKSEHAKLLVEKEMSIYLNNDKNKDSIINKITKVDDLKDKEYLKLKERTELLIVEKEEYEKQLERERNMYENKLIALKSQYEIKLNIYESALKHEKNKINDTETKAFDILNKQDQVSFYKKVK